MPVPWFSYAVVSVTHLDLRGGRTTGAVALPVPTSRVSETRKPFVPARCLFSHSGSPDEGIGRPLEAGGRTDRVS